MRNLIFGGIGVLWGGAVVLFALLGGGSDSGGSYGAGKVAGTVFGLLMFVVGLYYFIKGVQSISGDEPISLRKPKKVKRKRRPIP